MSSVAHEPLYREPGAWDDDEELREAVRKCCETQKLVGAKELRESFAPSRNPFEVSEEALRQILRSGESVSDIRTNTDITNCLVFHTTNLPGSVIDEELVALRREVDDMIRGRLRSLFDRGAEIEMSGHFWYPPGGFMGWHTNLRKPGWRFYINYAEEERRSFFRYRDPRTDRIVTSWDAKWNARAFAIRPDAPLWHAVYSETNRFSFGYTMPLADDPA